MDDSFKLRVEKIFGSLQSSQSSSQQQRPPLWSLSDDEVERREWRRESAADREDMLCSSSFNEFLKEERKNRSGRRKETEDDLDNDDDDDDDDDNDEGSSQLHSRKIDEYGDEWEIRSCLGMDSTLDNEEEEDEYDKVASGRENAGERLYMSDIADHGSFLNSHNILQRALNHATSNKDHCASHMAARIRLKEDDEEAQKLNYCDGSNSEIRELSDMKASDNGCHLRSILKRKDSGTGLKPQRVRFDSSCKDGWEEQFEKSEDHPTGILLMNSEDSDSVSLPAENDRAVPDYLQNPSRYTRYSFDSSSKFGEESNAQAWKDVLKFAPNSKCTESLLEQEDAPCDLPKPVTFIPKRKPAILQLVCDVSEVQEKENECKKSLRLTRLPVGIAAGAAKSDEDDATEDDIPEVSATNGTPVIPKGGRSYRVKSQPEGLD